jgi:hypothetical protein
MPWTLDQSLRLPSSFGFFGVNLHVSVAGVEQTASDAMTKEAKLAKKIFMMDAKGAFVHECDTNKVENVTTALPSLSIAS